jgi:hypothetical protein
VAIFGSFFSFVFTLALLLQDGIGLTPLGAGLSFAPLGIAFAVASILARGFVARFGARASSRSERAWLPSASWPLSSRLPAARLPRKRRSSRRW